MAHTGRCLCGQAHYTIAAEPLDARMCWCRDCQKIASGSATVSVLFPAESVEFSGEIAASERISDSGNRIERGFCPKCGSQIYSRTIAPIGHPIRIRAGTLDNPDLMAPQTIIWTASAPGWAYFDPALARFDRQPPPPASTPQPLPE